MPQWKPNNYKKTLSYPLIFLILGLLYLYWGVVTFYESAGFIQIINLVTSIIFVTYLVGRIYGELNAHKDFINISKHGIQFRETPGLAQGWLPVSKSLEFNQMKSIDIVKINNVFNSDSENMAIFILPVKGKAIVIGSKLDKDQIMKVGLALKGSVAISNTLQRFLGDDGQVKDVLDTAKQMWNSFKSKEK